jgi:hypothetical protein
MRDLSAISLAMQFDLSFVQRLHGSDRQHCPVPIPRRQILCPYLLLRFVSGTVFCGELRMTLIMAEDEVLSVAIAGVPKVAEFIARVPMEDRSRALDAAEKSYLETAHTLGYQDAEAQQWVSAVMSRLRLDESDYKLRMDEDLLKAW